MQLRKHQKETLEYVNALLGGEQKKRLCVINATPGAGKSLLPVIFSNLLPQEAEFLLWVVPRDSLKYQGEADFVNDIFPTDKRIRVATNEGDILKGRDGAVTTYQGIGANPDRWINLFKQKKGLLILDEYHHLSEGSIWHTAIDKMKELSSVTVCMTGTLARGDQNKIPYIDYDTDGDAIKNSPNYHYIEYSRTEAIKDGSILPIHFDLYDASGEYYDKEGFLRAFDTLDKSYDRLVTALQTEFSRKLIDISINKWLDYKQSNPWAKIIVVAPDVKTAREYKDYIESQYHFKTNIAVSEDSQAAKNAIKEYKSTKCDCLVSVGMCYEGFSVKQISHITCLTIIRSAPWIEQMIARANRCYPGKHHGLVIAPKDMKMLEAIKRIELEQHLGIVEQEKGTPKEKEEERQPAEALKIEPLQSEILHNNEVINPIVVSEPFIPDSEREKNLRQSINKTINRYVEFKSRKVINGETKIIKTNSMLHRKLCWVTIMQHVNNGKDVNGVIIKKPIADMTIEELEKVDRLASECWKVPANF